MNPTHYFLLALVSTLVGVLLAFWLGRHFVRKVDSAAREDALIAARRACIRNLGDQSQRLNAEPTFTPGETRGSSCGGSDG